MTSLLIVPKRSFPWSVLLLLLLLPCSNLGAAPAVFWASDSLEPGNAVLVYGGDLASVKQVKVWQVPDDAQGSGVKPGSDAVSQETYQSSESCLKFLLPKTFKPGVYAMQIAEGKRILLNRPQLWFVQPESLVPGLMENQAAPGAKLQLIGKDLLLPGDQGTARFEIRTANGKAQQVKPDKAEKFSVRFTLPSDLKPGKYELRASNGFGGEPGWSDPLRFEIKQPDAWPNKVFDVKTFGALGDDTADDTAAVRAALDAAEKNGGGVVYFPWGTYRFTDWIRIPPKTILRGENRDASLLKWPVDEPLVETDFKPAAIYGDTSYGVENLSIIGRKVNALLVDLSSSQNGVPELKEHVNVEGSHDVFIRNVAFHHWLLCSHPDRNPTLWAKRYTAPGINFSNRYGSIRNFEVSDCLFQGGVQSFSNVKNARVTRNRFSNDMGYCWTCLGSGAWYIVAEDNDIRGSSSWGYELIGLKYIYSARNICHNFVQGEREAMTLDISALPAIPSGPVPKGMHPIGGRNITWCGQPKELRKDGFTLEGIKATDSLFVGKTVIVLDGPGAGQFREITANTPTDFTIDRPWDVPITTESIIGLWDLPRYMITYRSEGYDTSAFNQLYGSFYEFIIDSCKVERNQGSWGQSGWFVQYRYNQISYGQTYHPKIGMPGKNRERNATFGYTGLVDGNLRITKFGSAQYESVGGKPIFVKDVVAHPVPGVRGCILKGNELTYNQRLVLAPEENPVRSLGSRDFLRMTDCLIDSNSIRHSAVGINVGRTVSNVLVTGNRFEDVSQPLVASPESVLNLDSK